MSYIGRVFWITGLSGAGKTTVSQHLLNKLKELGQPVILFDGDILREVFNDYRFDHAGRLALSKRYSKLCQLVASQAVDVIIATISMFHETHAWNRANIANYKEIYLKVPLDILKERDVKSVYASKNGQLKVENVVGLDGMFQEPISPDLIIENHGEIQLSDVVKKILALT